MYGSICPYCNGSASSKKGGDEGDGRNLDSAPITGDSDVIYPVVGWLVCIEGSLKGKDYRLIAKKNRIGSANGMDIQILGDGSVAKRNHAILVYDPSNRSTMLLPGDSHGLVYHNDEVVYAPRELLSYDTVKIGKSRYLFIPLCGEHFEWEEQKI
jgi:hypothetical protein